MRNNPGAYYDHYTNGWFCMICISFGFRKTPTVWIDMGAKLGNSPGRVFRSHFNSEFHQKNAEIKKLYSNLRCKEKEITVVDMLRDFHVADQENKTKRNRAVV